MTGVVGATYKIKLSWTTGSFFEMNIRIKILLFLHNSHQFFCYRNQQTRIAMKNDYSNSDRIRDVLDGGSGVLVRRYDDDQEWLALGYAMVDSGSLLVESRDEIRCRREEGNGSFFKKEVFSIADLVMISAT